jgi:hypothetical protein
MGTGQLRKEILANRAAPHMSQSQTSARIYISTNPTPSPKTVTPQLSEDLKGYSQ